MSEPLGGGLNVPFLSTLGKITEQMVHQQRLAAYQAATCLTLVDGELDKEKYLQMFPEIRPSHQYQRDSRITENVFKSIHSKVLTKIIENPITKKENETLVKDPFEKVARR